MSRGWEVVEGAVGGLRSVAGVVGMTVVRRDAAEKASIPEADGRARRVGVGSAFAVAVMAAARATEARTVATRTGMNFILRVCEVGFWYGYRCFECIWIFKVFVRR